MNQFRAIAHLSADDWIHIVAIAMALTLVLGTMVTRGMRIPRAAWPALLWIALLWAAIIATAALAFQHFRPGGF